MPSPVFYATVVPLVSWLLLKKVILDPIAKERQERERQRAMEANYERFENENSFVQKYIILDYALYVDIFKYSCTPMTVAEAAFLCMFTTLEYRVAEYISLDARII